MTIKQIAAELRRLDNRWKEAGGNVEASAPCQRAVANFVSENLDAILEKLES